MFEPTPEYLGAGDGFVHRCDPGNAYGCTEIQQRGHTNWPMLITVWPKDEHFRRTTGAEFKRLGIPEPFKLTADQQRMCSILGLTESELAIFLTSWEKVPYDKKLTGHIGPPETLEEVALHLSSCGRNR